MSAPFAPFGVSLRARARTREVDVPKMGKKVQDRKSPHSHNDFACTFFKTKKVQTGLFAPFWTPNCHVELPPRRKPGE